MEELFYSHKLTRESCYYPILSFHSWLGNYILFLVFSRNNIFSGENTISCSKAYVHRKTCLINITVPRDLVISFIFIKYALFYSLFEVSYDTYKRFNDQYCRSLHGLTYNTNYKRQIWSCNRWMSFPAGLVYLLGLKKASPYSDINIWIGSKGLSTGLLSIIFVSFRISRTYFLSYFLWEITTPSFYWSTSMPKNCGTSKILCLKMIA